MKKLLLFLIFVGAVCSPVYGQGIYNNSSSSLTSADSISITFAGLDAQGSPKTLNADDSLRFVVFSPGGTVVSNTVRRIDNSKIKSQAIGGGTAYCITLPVDSIDGAGVNGVFSYFIQVVDKTLAESTPKIGTFQLYTTRDFNVALDSLYDDAKNLRRRFIIKKGVVAASPSPTTTSFASAALNEAANSYWQGAKFVLYTGNAAGQSRTITGFTASNDVIQWSRALTAAPSAGDSFYISGVSGDVNVANWRLAQPNALVSGRVDASTGAITAGAIDAILETDTSTIGTATSVGRTIQRAASYSLNSRDSLQAQDDWPLHSTVGTNLDATVSSRSTFAAATDKVTLVDSSAAAIKWLSYYLGVGQETAGPGKSFLYASGQYNKDTVFVLNNAVNDTLMKIIYVRNVAGGPVDSIKFVVP